MEIINIDMKSAICRYTDYRSVIDYFNSKVDEGLELTRAKYPQSIITIKCGMNALMWIKKSRIVGTYRDRNALRYDGLDQNIVGLYDIHAVYKMNDLPSNEIYITPMGFDTVVKIIIEE